MDNLLNNKKIIVVCFILILMVYVIYYIISNNLFYNNEETEEPIKYYLKNYEANEFIPVYIEEKDMALKYLLDYKNNMINDINAAYLSLNEDYRNKKFGNLENYTNYVNELMSLAVYNMEIDKYYISKINDHKFFRIYDKSGRYYIFKEISIMNYEVYLDEDTVELK